MLNRVMRNSVKKEIKFKTAIKQKSYISSPINNEAISSNIVLLTAGINAMSEENESFEYRFEISSDVAFFNTLISITTKDNTYQTTLEPGQYYTRTRLESLNKDYSNWSEIITFIVINNSDCSCDINSEIVEDILSETEFFDDDIQELKIIDITPNGTTPEELYIYFNKELNFKTPKYDNGFDNQLIKIGSALSYRKEL